MNEGINRYTSRFFSRPLDDRRQAIGKQDYKARLWGTSICDDHETEVAEGSSCPYADQIRSAAADASSGVSFQSLAVASLQTLRTVLACEQQAALAAISLAQGEKLESMIRTAHSTVEAIAGVLDSQGNHMLHLSTTGANEPSSERSWWFALTETIEAIEDGTKRIMRLACGQPKGSASRRLSAVVVRLLRKQHHQLLAEADAWIA